MIERRVKGIRIERERERERKRKREKERESEKEKIEEEKVVYPKLLHKSITQEHDAKEGHKIIT